MDFRKTFSWLLILALLAAFWGGVFALAKPALIHKVYAAEELGEVSWSIENGLLTATLEGAGPHQAHIRWDVPTVADMPDLKGFDISFGTASSDYDILDAYVVTGSLQPGANEILVKGLSSTTDYFWKVRARDSEDNVGSYCAEQTCTSEAAWTPNGSPTEVDQSDFPLTLVANTHYRLTENVTVNSGTCMTCSADGATFDFNGFTITGGQTGAGRGVHCGGTAGTIDNTRLFDSQGGGGVIMGSQAGCECIYIASSRGTGNVIQDIELEYNGLASYCVEDDADMGGMRIFNVLFDMNGPDDSDISNDSGGFASGNGVKVYDSAFDVDSDDDRTYCFSAINTASEVWECTATIDEVTPASTQNHAFYADFGGNGETYMHDIDVTATAHRCRLFLIDGDSSNKRLLWNTVDMTNVTNDSTASAFHIRNPGPTNTVNILRDCSIGFCAIELGGNAEVSFALGATGNSFSGEGDVSWHDAYFYHNTVNNIAASRQGFLLDKDQDEVYVWGDTYNKALGFTGLAAGWGTGGNGLVSQDYHFNNITIVGGGSTHFDGPASTHTNINISGSSD